MLNRKPGCIPIKVKSKDMPLEGMRLIMNGPNYLSMGLRVEFHESIITYTTWFHVIVVTKDPDLMYHKRLYALIN